MHTGTQRPSAALWATLFVVFLVLTAFACDDSPSGLTPTPTPIPTATPTATVTPTPTPTRPPGAVGSFLHVDSTPAGATVRVGIQYVNGVADPTTGRIVGTTPLTVQIYASDLSIVPSSGNANLITLLQLPGYYDNWSGPELGPSGTLEAGRTYTMTVHLNPIQ